jgi:alpha-1,2-mannosyltransferase
MAMSVRTRERVAGGGCLLAMAVALTYVLVRAVSSDLIDLHVYRVGGQAWLEGVRLYAPGFPKPLTGPALPFTYPPIAAVLFSGLALVPWLLAVLVWTVAGLALLTLVCVIGARDMRWSAERTLVTGLGLAAGSVLLEPVRTTLEFGQINLLIMGLVAADCLLPKTKWPRGLLIGFAAAIKLTPLVFLLFFLPRKQFKPVFTAIASFVGFGLAGFALAPTDTKQYWFVSLLDPGRVGGLAYSGNQSLRGMVHRLGMAEFPTSATWAVLSLGAVVLAWVAVVRAGDDRLSALLAVAVCGLLISPVSWTHHWVWVAPGLLLLVHRSRLWAALLALLFTVPPVLFLPNSDDRELSWAWWQHLLGDSYVLVGITVLVVLATSAGRRRGASDPRVTSAVPDKQD